MTDRDNLDRLLVLHFRDEASRGANGGDAAARVLAALSPLPLQRRRWRHWPAVLLGWDFAPAWPRVAVLAGCAVLGFAVGVVGPALRGRDGSSLLSTRGDVQIVSLLSEPDPMTGELP